MTPDAADVWLPEMSARTVLALLAVCDGAGTVREVGDRIGVESTTALRLLTQLREVGLVDWEPNTGGTLRPMVKIVASSPWTLHEPAAVV